MTLPSYGSPPVVEVICGITFEPLHGVLAPHLGRLWDVFRTQYPTCKEADPLVPIIETFSGEVAEMRSVSFPLLPRVWFISQDESGIIQVQRDRFIQNWRKVRPTDEYPRYSTVKDKFKEGLASFQTFLAENQLGAIQPLQYEMTYLNQIPAGVGWQTNGDLGNLLPDFVWRNTPRFLGRPERVNWRTSFLLPNNSGRLHVSVQTTTRRADNVPLIIVEITARGVGQDRSIENMWSWFDVAREWIVKGFTDITDKQVQEKYWRKTP